jgi:PiT family inorganic phosphate transporter
MRLVKLTPAHGFAAETAASGVLLGTAWLGFPVSTTHVIATSIMGVGASERLSAVRWGLTRDILLAWLVTLPASALIGGLCARAAVALFGG